MVLLADRWVETIDAALAALSSDRASLGMTLTVSGDVTRVMVGRLRVDLGRDDFRALLSWERLIDALPVCVERARLDAMHGAAGVRWPAPWSVCTSATTLAWMTAACGGAGTTRWKDLLTNVLAAADADGEVLLRADIGKRSSMAATLRSRRLLASVALGARVHYRNPPGMFRSAEKLPATVATAGVNRDVAAVIDAPWLAGADVDIEGIAIDGSGTTIRVREAVVPLSAVPDAALTDVARVRDPHVPWVVTCAERSALDDVDAAVHEMA